jgi:hypothetical protein
MWEIPDKENAVTKGEASMAWGKIYLIKLGREDEIKACADNYSKYYNLAMNQKHADNHENHSYMELMSPASKAFE